VLVFEGMKRKKIPVLLSAYVLHQIFVCTAFFGVTFSELLKKSKKKGHPLAGPVSTGKLLPILMQA